MNEFKIGDVLAKMGDAMKWVVWFMDSYHYFLKPYPGYGEDCVATRHTVDKDICNANFVKVGEWDYEKGIEMEDDEDVRGVRR